MVRRGWSRTAALALFAGSLLFTSPRFATAAPCDALPNASTAQQVATVQVNPACAAEFVQSLERDPKRFLDAFYPLVSNPGTTGALFFAVYEELRTGRFRFDTPVVEDLQNRLPSAVASCSGSSRCAEWNTFIVAPIRTGGAFRCPVAGASVSVWLSSVPYADYLCAETAAIELAQSADQALVGRLLDISRTHAVDWSRRNALRVLGRFASRGVRDRTALLVRSAMAGDVKAALINRIEADASPFVLEDAIWILDSYFYPSFESQAAMTTLTANRSQSSSVRFRAATAVGRLLFAKRVSLSAEDLAFIRSGLQSDELWVRAAVAFACRSLKPGELETSTRDSLLDAVRSRWTVETVLTVQIELARALDDNDGGSTFEDGLRDRWEARNLVRTVSRGEFTIRSSLSWSEMDALLGRIEGTRIAFRGLLDLADADPVPQDRSDALTVVVFANRETYSEYMSAFVGSGSQAGGLYIEGSGRLYTYARTPAESVFTLEELVQHEFGHYLSGRYLFPGSWGDSGYHDEPKGWFDEGLAEVLAGLPLNGAESVSLPLRAPHVSQLCRQPQLPGLASLLSRRAGYDQDGVFDYASAWSFTHFLASMQRTTLREFARSFREGSYRLQDAAAIAGRPVSELEAAWHNQLRQSCTR